MSDPRIIELTEHVAQLAITDKLAFAATLIDDAGGLNDAELYGAAEFILQGVLLELAALRRIAMTDDVRH